MGRKHDFTNITFKQLRLEEGQWALDMELLVKVSESLLRPIQHTVSGADAILFYHQRAGDTGLLAAVQQLLAAPHNSPPTRFFEPHEGAWVSIPEGLEESSDVAAQAVELERRQSEMAGMSRQIQQLTQLVRQLDTALVAADRKIEALEKKLESGKFVQHQAEAPSAETANGAAPLKLPEAPAHIPAPIPDPAFISGALGASPSATDHPAMQVAPLSITPQPAPGPAVAATLSSPASHNQLSEQQPPSAADSFHPAQAPANAPAAPGSSEAEVAIKAPAPATPDKPWVQKLPLANQVGDVLEMLVGDPISFNEIEPAKQQTPAQLAKHKMWISRLVNDQDEIVGAVLCDLEAVVNMGGTMMMLPAGSLKEMRQKKNPSAEVIDATAEVINTLTSLINNESRNTHVRSTPLENFTGKEEPWLGGPADRKDYHAADPAGLFVMLARPRS